MSTYRIAEQIGTGGMATVHLAIQEGPGGFEKLVAFKRMMSWVSSDAEMANRFLKEARLAASLNHPNVVSTLAVGSDEQGSYIVLEYIRGESVAYMLSSLKGVRYGIPVPISCHIAAQVAAALDYAHSQLGPDGRPAPIVHRDVSPSNVMVGYNGSVKLLDFGIATRPAEGVTRNGSLKGKLTHMAPEQLAGVPADPKSDVFQLGILLWEMLTMRRLFPGNSDAERMHNVLYRPILAPSEYNDAVPPELDEIVLSALARVPDQRCPSAAVFQERLETCMPRELPSLGGRELRNWMAVTFPQRLEYWEGLEQEAVTAPSVRLRSSAGRGGKGRVGQAVVGLLLVALIGLAVGVGVLVARFVDRRDAVVPPVPAVVRPKAEAPAAESPAAPLAPAPPRAEPVKSKPKAGSPVIHEPAPAPESLEEPVAPPSAPPSPTDAPSPAPAPIDPPPEWRMGDDDEILDPFAPRE